MNRRSQQDQSFGPRRGFMVADALTGLFIVALLISVLATATTLRQRNANHLANQRQALHLAEQTLAGLQSPGPATLPSEPQAKISVIPTGQRIGNLQWVQVTAVVENRRSTLVGVARADIATTQPTTSPGVAP